MEINDFSVLIQNTLFCVTFDTFIVVLCFILYLQSFEYLVYTFYLCYCLFHFPLKVGIFLKIIIMVAICFPLILLHFSRWVWFSFHGRESRETYSLTTQGHIRIFKALRIPQKIPNGIQVVWRFFTLERGKYTTGM